MNTAEHAIKSLKENPEEWRFDFNKHYWRAPFCLVNGDVSVWIANGFWCYELFPKGFLLGNGIPFSFIQKLRAHRHIRKIIKRLRNG